MTWAGIDGWLTPAEGAALQLLAVGADVLELGSYKGRSTVAMAEVARRVTAVDWFRGDGGCGHRDTLDEFLANLERFGVRDKVTVVVGCTADVSFPPAFDLAFIDDDHDGDAPLVSTRLALSCLRPGGVIAWHDWDRPEVRTAALACGLTPLAVRGSLAWARV